MRTSPLTLITITAAVFGVFTAAATQAADLYSSAPAPAASYHDAGLTVATGSWSGFYAGGTIGGLTSADPELDFDFDEYTLSAGAQVGYLQQLGTFVVGAEVQGMWTNELQYVLTPGSGLQQDWSVAAKGRAGVALGDLLVYGTGGAIFSELKSTGSASIDEEWHAGAVFGGGVERKLGDNISVRAEYLQTRFFEVESAVAGVNRTDDLTNHTISLGLNYRF
jgi:opacity protein-like surface antigen